MELHFQEILVLLTFASAIWFMFTKFVYKPKFIFGRKKSSGKACDSGCGSCH